MDYSPIMASSNSDSDIDNPLSSPDVAGPSKGRKCRLTPGSHKRALAKSKRNKGEAYASPASQCAIPHQVIGPVCWDGCFMKVAILGVLHFLIFLGSWGLQSPKCLYPENSSIDPHRSYENSCRNQQMYGIAGIPGCVQQCYYKSVHV